MLPLSAEQIIAPFSPPFLRSVGLSMRWYGCCLRPFAPVIFLARVLGNMTVKTTFYFVRDLLGLRRNGQLSILAALLSLGATANIGSATPRTQTLSIEAGWNAVFLQVEPTEHDPAVLLKDTPFEIVSAFFPTVTSLQFISDPEQQQWKKENWATWYAPSREDSALSSLGAIYGNKGYLIFSSRAFQWSVSGEARLRPPRWQPDSFNLAGLPVSQDSTLTFETYFASSPAHLGQPIYALLDGKWSLIRNPAATLIKAGQAYWIFCKGASDYQGPIGVKLSGGTNLNFGTLASEQTITLQNNTAAPAQIFIETISSLGQLPLNLNEPGPNALERNSTPLPKSLLIPNLAAGSRKELRLQARRERLKSATTAALFKVTSSAGVELWFETSINRDGLHPEATQ
jgi:hypothetical protein